MAYYKFDENTGSEAADSSGLENTGNINGALWTSGVYGSALSFDGTDDYVLIDHSDRLNLTSELTLMAWIRITSVPFWEWIINKPRMEGADNFAYCFCLDWRGYMCSGLSPADHPGIGGYYMSGDSQVPLGTWTHVAFTFDGQQVKFYMNGVEDKVSWTNYSGDIRTSTHPVTIGCVLGDDNSYFAGAIDEVKIYKQALTQEEINDAK